jgi:DNA polymerase
MVGEQPGDHEDLSGKPFVGPAGRLLDRALAQAGIERANIYLTNAVKHFKYEPRGKRRLHKGPSAAEVDHCRWWLDREIDVIKPALVVALGATAARALTGRMVTVARERGRLMTFGAGWRGLITAHPAFMLRLPDPAAQAVEYERLVADLRLAASVIQAAGE